MAATPEANVETDGATSDLLLPTLRQDYHDTVLLLESSSSSSSESSWWIDWNIEKCVYDCQGPPPCGGSPPDHDHSTTSASTSTSTSYYYNSKEECCTAFDTLLVNPAGRCVQLTARQEVELLIEQSERELIPKFLRLGFHDCVGGCDGCVDLSNPDNNGLLEPIEAIYPIVEQFKGSYSRADVWALATLVSADLSLIDDDDGNNRPEDISFSMRFIGRMDCSGADDMGVGGPDVDMPSNDLSTHGLLDFFRDEFGFDADETVAIMGAHAVAVATRENVGFGNLGKEEGWVFEAEEYILDNRYYEILVGDDGDPVSLPDWTLELVNNTMIEGDFPIPQRYQWFHEKAGEAERPIMTNADMALVRDLGDHMSADANGTEGFVDCAFKDEQLITTRLRRDNGVTLCPVASQTIGKVVDYALDNYLFLRDFESVLEKMVSNGYRRDEPIGQPLEKTVNNEVATSNEPTKQPSIQAKSVSKSKKKGKKAKSAKITKPMSTPSPKPSHQPNKHAKVQKSDNKSGQSKAAKNEHFFSYDITMTAAAAARGSKHAIAAARRAPARRLKTNEG